MGWQRLLLVAAFTILVLVVILMVLDLVTRAGVT